MKMKMKEKDEDHTVHTQAPSKLKPISKLQSKTKTTSSKTERKKALVRLRLSMLEQGTDEISNVSCVKEGQLTPVPTPEPLEISRPTKTRGEKKNPEVKTRIEAVDSDFSLYNPTKRRLSGCNSNKSTPIILPSRSVQQSREQSSYSNSSAMKRAKEVQEKLSDEYPSLVKNMLHSHIASGFWLGLPKKFCVEHLPKSDTMMKLIDENGESSYAKYLAAKVGLSGGWRGFSIAHNLEEGDVVVFQLVKKTTFKVYIIRRNALGENDGALGLINLDTCDNVLTSNDDGDGDGDGDDNDDGDNDEKENEIEDQDKILSGSPISEDVGSEVLDWIKLSEPDESVNLESFDKFSILLDGSVSINAKFPDHIRRKYYNLCTDQNASLHEKLLKGLNCTLVVGIINETINISDAIRSCNCSTSVPESDLLTYDKTLQGFELLGMNVGFIRLEIQKLMRRVIDEEEMVAFEAIMEREVVGEKMKKFEVKLLELRKQMEEMDEEIEVMEQGTARKRLKLKEMENSS